MSVLLTMWVWLQSQLATARRDDEGWGAVEWMVIMVFVVGLAYAANEAADGFIQKKAGELFSS
jgi:hypothetical protein